MKKTTRSKNKKNNFRFFKDINWQQLKKSLTEVLMFLFLVFLPSQVGKHFFFDFSYLSGVRVDYLAPTIYLTDIIFLLLAFLNYKIITVNLWKIKWIFLFLIINFLIAFSKPIAFYYSFKILQLLAVFYIFKNLILSPKKILIAFLIGGIVEIFLSLAQIYYQQSLQGFFYLLGERYFTLGTPGIAKASINGVEFLRPYGTFSHPNSLAGFYLLTYFFITTDKKFRSFIFLRPFSLFIFTLLILISFSKIAILTFLVLNILIFFSYFKDKCKICSFSQLLLLLILSIIFLQTKSDPLTLTKRVELLKNSLIILSKYPLFGVGLGNYLLAQNQFVLKYSFFNQPVHNIFLLFLNEFGVFFSLFIFYQLFLFFKKRIFVFYLLFTILLTGLFDHYWLTLEQNFLLMGTTLGLFLNQKD